MYIQIIERVTQEVIRRQTQESFERFIMEKVASCEVGLWITAFLFRNKDDPKKYDIKIPRQYSSDDKLIGFVHEVLHIFYMAPELPGSCFVLKEHCLRSYDFLEETIEFYSNLIIKNNKEFIGRMFELKFGFSADILRVDLK